MKYTTPIVAMLTVALMAFDCSAQPPGRQRGEKGKNGAGQRPGPGGDRDPAQMVARMMKEFDKDGDSKLNLRELTAMFTTMRERRENGGRPGPGQGQRARSKDGQNPGAAKGKRRQSDNNGQAGGDKPKRPPTE